MKRPLALSSLISALLLVGCSDMKLEDFATSAPALTVEEYFDGRTEAWGMFEDRFGRVRRQFKVDVDGSFDGRELTLVENFAYADGEKDHRTWHITPLGDGRYEGRSDDVLGAATGEARGNAVHWAYDMNLVIGDSTWRVHFDDWMLLQSDEVMINRAVISKFGITIGQVTLFFRKI